MRPFNYSPIKEQKWDSDVLGLIAAIYKEAGKQELYLKQCPEELEKLVEIAKIQNHRMPLRASLPRTQGFGSLLRRRLRQGTVMNRRLQGIAMS